MIRSVRRRTFDAVVRALARLSRRAPKLAFRMADLIAPLVYPTLRRDELARVFPELPRAMASRVRVRAPRVAMRNYVLAASIRQIGDATPSRALALPNEMLAHLRPPLILGTFHIGALASLGGALAQLPGEVLVLRATQPPSYNVPNLTFEITRGDDQRRALVFHRAIEWLTNGRFVFMPLDPEQAARLSAPFLGKTLQLARGPFALSRITRVPIAPLVARWRGARIEYLVGEPLPVLDDEQAMAAAAAAWLERYLRDEPLEIGARILMLTR